MKSWKKGKLATRRKRKMGQKVRNQNQKRKLQKIRYKKGDEE